MAAVGLKRIGDSGAGLRVVAESGSGAAVEPLEDSVRDLLGSGGTALGSDSGSEAGPGTVAAAHDGTAVGLLEDGSLVAAVLHNLVVGDRLEDDRNPWEERHDASDSMQRQEADPDVDTSAAAVGDADSVHHDRRRDHNRSPVGDRAASGHTDTGTAVERHATVVGTHGVVSGIVPVLV